MTGAISAMRNLGKVTQAMLIEVGIPDAEALRAVGAVGAYLRLRFVFGNRVSLNALYAMDAALTGSDWREVSPERKAWLRAAAELKPGD
ncbi:TfoX/Sxy family DNA transformation protein [Pelagibacterium limicola]|uniref:TfoX/Sxy family DNA transformation protein n=1 Tax=Pelagibacterium limicola TaxID=2791022 RepID=UPI0018AF94CC|nr:TfoX/Sxy family DNA transformation protein [Pelagibacterium limicola]